MKIIIRNCACALLVVLIVVMLIMTASPVSKTIKDGVIDVVKDFSEFQEDMDGRENTLTENLALGKVATASGEEAVGTVPNNATDGDEESRWSSNFEENAWLVVDLWNTYKINKVVINWESAYGTKYRILTSEDGDIWTEVANIEDGKGGTEEITFDATEARYVKFQGIERALPYGYSMYEFKVYGTRLVKENEEAENIARNAIVESSGDESKYTQARNVVDGDLETRWGSPFTDEAWISVNFGKKNKIEKIVIYWEEAYGEEYDIQTSIDGKKWKTVAKILKGTGGKEEIEFEPTNARYVKMQGIKRGTEYGYSIKEIEVYTKK